MHALSVAGLAVVATTVAALAAVLSPNEIQATFFNGEPFTASTGTIKYKMTYAADGKMTREQIGKSGAKSDGTWRLSKDGFCSTWKGSKANCYRVETAGDNKWSVMKGTTTVATWTK
jgi:hypothetical protein